MQPYATAVTVNSDNGTSYGPYQWGGGPGILRVWGTFAGATLTLKWRDHTTGETEKVTVGSDTTFTAAGGAQFNLDNHVELFVEASDLDDAGTTAVKFSIGATGIGNE